MWHTGGMQEAIDTKVTSGPARVTIMRPDSVGNGAIRDLVSGFARHEVWTRFAVHEIRQRFRRSVLGPFWLTASMGVFVGALGLINATLFNQDVSQTLPYIAIGVIVWGFLSACISEGSTTFISRESYIRNVPLPISLHIYQMLARNGIIMGFNMVIYLGVLIWSRTLPGPAFFLIVFSAPLLLVNVAWMSLAAAILSTRYRDIPQVIASVLQVVFFLTPIFWSTAAMPTRPHFVQFNPLFHLLEIVREPLLGNAPHLTSWGISVMFAAAGCLVTYLLYRRAYTRIAYWV